MITKDVCKQIGEELATAVAEIAARHGLKGQVRGGTFDVDIFKPRIEFETPERRENEGKRFAALFGLPVDIVGQTLAIQGIRYTVTALLPDATKRPVEMKRLMDGRMFAFEARAVQRALGLPEGGLTLTPRPFEPQKGETS